MNRRLFFKTLFLLMITISLLNSGCSTLSAIMGDEPQSDESAPKSDLVKFSETPSVLNPSNREYHRMTKAKMEEESDLGAKAGSMWASEGQSAYLFSQNKTRHDGDVLKVKLEGSAQKQIETKVSVIKKLIKQLEEEELKAQQTETLAENGETPNPDQKSARAPASEAKKEEKEEPLDLAQVPTRIVERMADGNYRVKGTQPFMIGKREYKVIVTGMIRSEDFNDEGVGSEKLIDPQYDVVSLRRSQQ